MNETMITNWNNKVGKHDIVFHLGDFAFCGSKEYNELLSRLNGKIYLIKGNHDNKNLRQGYSKLFADIQEQMTICIGKYSVYLNHYPFLCFTGSYHDHVLQLFGHVHSGPHCTVKDLKRLKYLYKSQYDVGVDNNNFTPVSWEEIIQKINKESWIKRFINKIKSYVKRR